MGLGSVPLDTRSKPEKVADAIEEPIRTGKAAPGTRLGTKAQLAAAFAVAPATMDGALRLLVDRGLVEVRPGAKGGVNVAEQQRFLQLGGARWPLRGLAASHPATAIQTASVALTLEPLVIAEAVQNRTRSDRTKLVAAARALATMDAAADYPAVHRAVHTALLASTHNEVLINLVPSLWSRIFELDAPPSLKPGFDSQQWAATHAAVHLRIVEAVVDADLAAALTALHEHGATVADLYTMTPGYRALWKATLPKSPGDNENLPAHRSISALPNRSRRRRLKQQVD
jgi:GntR family transcriptional repressor for pyruvate dehydrogenase complex